MVDSEQSPSIDEYSTPIVGSSGSDIRRQWPVDEWVADVAASGLPSSRRLDSLVVHRFAWTEFLAACEENRVLGLLAEALRAGACHLPDYQRESVESRCGWWLAHDLVVERQLLRVAGVLQGAGVEFRVLKGVALANSVYRDPSLRLFGDIDLAVDSDHFVRAAEAIAAALSAVRELPELRPGFDQRFGREILLRSDGTEVDLHRTLVDGPFGLWIPLDDLFAEKRTFLLGGQQLPRLGDPARFVHACMAAVLGDWPPRRIAQRDIAELLLGGERAGTLEAAPVQELAARWRATAVVALAIRMTVADLGLETDHPLIDWAQGHRPGPGDRLLLASYRGRARGYTSQALSVFALPSWRDRFDYVRAILRPSREYLDARGFRRGDRLRRAVGLRAVQR
ncbi:unannotated protein [freshwater metagenome]|uniref:Unannotated protein n=1 Tax=freshwater metagenome TaxID=449393 RepID=A0A6J7A3W4_9ZZZZ